MRELYTEKLAQQAVERALAKLGAREVRAEGAFARTSHVLKQPVDAKLLCYRQRHTIRDGL